jgi:hypothetical protein
VAGCLLNDAISIAEQRHPPPKCLLLIRLKYVLTWSDPYIYRICSDIYAELHVGLMAVIYLGSTDIDADQRADQRVGLITLYISELHRY